MDLTSEQLNNFLPSDIIEFALGDKEETRSKVREWILSPQIAPLESRIYNYMLSKREEDASSKITLSNLFDEVNIEDEILKSVQEITQTAYIHSNLLTEGLYEKYFRDIKEHLSRV